MLITIFQMCINSWRLAPSCYFDNWKKNAPMAFWNCGQFNAPDFKDSKAYEELTLDPLPLPYLPIPYSDVFLRLKLESILLTHGQQQQNSYNPINMYYSITSDAITLSLISDQFGCTPSSVNR